MLTTVIIVAITQIIAALLSAAETGLTSVSRPQMHQMERDGHLKAAIVNKLLDNKDRLLGAILLGNNIVNIFASAVVTSLMIEMFGEAGVAYATAVMTVIIIVFGEILPKTYAINHPDKASLALAPLIQAMVKVLFPIVHAIQLIVDATLRLFRVNPSSKRDLGAILAELRGVIEFHAAPEIKPEKDMLKGVLDLGNITVEEIMVHRKKVFMIDAGLPAGQILDLVANNPFTRIPLKGEGEHIIGVLHAKALLKAMRDNGGNTDGIDIASLVAPPWFIPETTLLKDQLQAFKTRREHFAIVVDEYGSFMGIVTLEDIIEEIVGDIADEHDIFKAQGDIRKVGENSWIIAGHVTLRDINREFDWNLPDDKATTLAGLLLYETRRIPEPHQVFSFHGLRFEVLKKQRHQLTAIKVNKDSDNRPA